MRARQPSVPKTMGGSGGWPAAARLGHWAAASSGRRGTDALRWYRGLAMRDARATTRDQPTPPNGPIFVIGSAALGDDPAAADARLAPAHLAAARRPTSCRTWSRSSGKHWRLLERTASRASTGSSARATSTPTSRRTTPRAGQGALGREGPHEHAPAALRRRAVPRRAVRPPPPRRPSTWWPRIRDRWGYRSAAACRARRMARYVEAARAFGARLPAGRFHELRYEALVARPGAEMRRAVRRSWARPGSRRSCDSTRPSTTAPSATTGSPPSGGARAATRRPSTVARRRRAAQRRPSHACAPATKRRAAAPRLGYPD